MIIYQTYFDVIEIARILCLLAAERGLSSRKVVLVSNSELYETNKFSRHQSFPGNSFPKVIIAADTLCFLALIMGGIFVKPRSRHHLGYTVLLDYDMKLFSYC